MANEKDEIVLVKYEAKSFMGIDSSRPVVIDFSSMRKNRFVELSGDQGQGKTSTLYGLMYALCGNVPFEKKRLMNSVDNGIDTVLEFKHNDENYKIEASSTRINLKKEVKEGKWQLQNGPVEMIKEMFGPVGMFPMNVKEMDGDKQIEFFQKMFGSGDDATKRLKKLKEDRKSIYNDRRDLTRDQNTLKSALDANPLYANYEASLEKYKTPVIIDTEKAKYEQIKKDYDQFNKYNEGVEKLKEAKSDSDDLIESLKTQLAAAEAASKELGERIEKNEKWLKDNNSIIQKFKKADAEWVEVAQMAADYTNWQNVLKQEKQYMLLIEKTTDLTAEIDKKDIEILKETKKCLPAVEGLTIKVATGIDKEDKPEGVFYLVPGKENEQGIHELSESEYADMWCKIWEMTEVPIVVIENISSFGSTFIKTLNQFVKNGGTVFYSKMDRKVKELQVEFKSKVD